jgi:hypothetical protein
MHLAHQCNKQCLHCYKFLHIIVVTTPTKQKNLRVSTSQMHTVLRLIYGTNFLKKKKRSKLQPLQLQPDLLYQPAPLYQLENMVK